MLLPGDMEALALVAAVSILGVGLARIGLEVFFRSVR